MPPVTFADAQRVLKARVLPANVNQGVTAAPKTNKTSTSASTTTSVMKISGDGNALGPASIAELGRSLRHHPDLIYQYVRNTIEYYPVFGSQKGALGAVLDNQATAHDQATLMVELLRASGVEATRYFVSSEPLDELLCIWASHRIPGRFAIVHTHPADLKALLSRLEA
ncbi:transglutaminase domain-containing protein [Variovorax sp. WS11]|nr:transglutaminase domain-containing protein [Variovorax sp. WS11]